MIAIRCEVSDYRSGEHGETCLAHVETKEEVKAKLAEYKLIDAEYEDCLMVYTCIHYDEDNCPECGFSPNMDIPF